MKTDVTIYRVRGRLFLRKVVIAQVTDSKIINHGVDSLSYMSSNGSLTLQHHGDPVTISGTVRGNLTLIGNVETAGIRVGGSLIQTSYLAPGH